MTRGSTTGLVLSGATLVTLEPPAVERADLRLAAGRIAAKAPRLAAAPGETTVDLAGKLLLPGLVCAHTHLYHALARGMPAPPFPPQSFPEALERIWWRLDRALDEDAIYLSALVGAIEAARNGVTTLVDHHASPACVSGSLALVRRAVEEVGLRAVLSYEVTDRGGPVERDRGLEENRALLAAPKSTLIRGMVGAHSSFTLSQESLRAVARLAREFEVGVHVHVAEDACDDEDARRKYGVGALERLLAEGLVSNRAVLAGGARLSARDVSLLAACGAWVAHLPRTNMRDQVGYAPAAEPGLAVALGTDGLPADLFAEARAAWFKGRDAARDTGRGPSLADCLRFLAGGQRLATTLFGLPLGSFQEGAAADLVVLDYPVATPLHPGNVAEHVVLGFSSAHVESVLVEGRFVVQDRKLRRLDLAALHARARSAAQRVWDRMTPR